MPSAAEYRKFADQCRAIAAKFGEGEKRDTLLSVADEWENMAERRERLLFPDRLRRMFFAANPSQKPPA